MGGSSELKKIFRTCLLLVVCFGIMLPNVSSAQTPETNTIVAVSKINSVKQVHSVFVKNGLVSKSGNGQLVISSNVEDYGIDPGLLEKYKKTIKSLNFGIEKGVIKLDQELTPILLSKDQIINNMKKSDGQSTSNKIYTGSNIIAYSIPIPYPTSVVRSLVTRNRNELEDVYDSALQAARWGGGNPYSVAVGYFVGKVRPGGDWDYKVVPGYSPWYKNFYCYLFGGREEVHNSKWIGNYNYGFVGEFLFSKSALVTGSAVEARGKPDYKGQATTKRGYDDAKTYW